MEIEPGMKTNGGLMGSLFHAAVIVIGAAALWGLEISRLPEGSPELDFLLWPVAAAAGLSLAIDLVLRLLRTSHETAEPSVPEESRPPTVTALLMVRRLLRHASWSALFMGAMAVLAGTQPEPGNFQFAIVGTGAVLGLTAAVRTASIPFPVVGMIFSFPWFRLLLLGSVSVLLQRQEWFAAYGFHSAPLLPALWAAMGAAYLGSALRNADQVSDGSDDPDPPPRTMAAQCVTLAAVLATASVGALIAWGILGSMPSIRAVLLDRSLDVLLPGRTLLYSSQLFEARHLVVGFVLSLGLARKLPSVEDDGAGTDYITLLKAGAYAVSGYMAWLVAARLAPLGQGYPLVGAAVAGGLFASAAVMVVRSLVTGSGGGLTDAARWLSQSTIRAFFLVASLVLYGLILRPMLYEAIAFAPIYEWLLVLVFAFGPINRLRKGVRAEIAPEMGAPSSWTGWTRHYQVSEERRDPRMVGLVGLQERFVGTGEWQRLWNYLVGLLLRNETPIQSIPAVFAPLTSYHLASVTPRLWPRSQKSATKRREAALADTLDRVKAALALPSAPLEALDEARLREIGSPLLDQGAAPEQLAVTLTAAYWQHGLDLGSAAARWFSLMIFVDDPTAGVGIGACLRWCWWSIFRRGRPRWDRQQRQQIIDGAASHLFGAKT